MKINNATPIINKKQSKKNVSFQGKGLSNLLSLNRQGPMCRNLFLLNALTFMLGSRIVTSRDKDERREILIRDLPTIFIAVMGVPVIGKFVTKLIEKKSGFALIGKNNNPLSYGQINNLYTYDSDLASELEGYTNRLLKTSDNVKLKNVYSKLSKEIKEGIKSLSDNNTDFIKQNKELSNKIIDALKTGSDKILKRAELLKTIPSAASFLITLTSIGIFVPKLNIFITKKVNKSRAKEEQIQNEQQNSQVKTAS